MPGRWQLFLYDACMRAFPRDVRDADGDMLCAMFVDRRVACGGRLPAWLDVLLECADVVVQGLVLRVARVRGRPWAQPSDHRLGRWAGGRPPGELPRALALSIRTLARRPAWSLLVVGTLGVGIGATTAVFSVVDGVALRALPYEAPDRLIRIGGVRAGRPGLGSISVPNFRDLEARVTGLSQVAASTPSSIAIGGLDGPADQVRGAYVSGAFFELLGRRPELGRAIDGSDDRAGAPVVAVLSHAIWRTRFGGADVVGRVVRLDGRPVTIVGVMGPAFQPPEGAHLRATLLWLPLAAAPLPIEERGLSFLDVIGRMATGVARPQVDAELDALGAGLREAHDLPARQFSTFRAAPLARETIGDAGATLGLLQGAVTLLLVIACANVANLLMVRTLERTAELAVRVSLGASRRRIVAGVALEAVLLSLVGGLLGLPFARLGVEAVKRATPIDLPRLQEVTVDLRILGFAIVLSLLVGLTVGLIPGLRAIRGDAWASLAGTLRTGGGAGRTRNVLVGAQAALGLVLLVGASLLGHSLLRLHRVDPGFDTEALRVVSVRLAESPDVPGDAHVATLDALLREVSAVSDVRTASITTGAPFTDGGWTVYVQPEGSDLPEEELSSARIGLHQVSAGHLSGIGARMVAGREIMDTDGARTAPVVVISETLARIHWDGDAIGRRLVVGGDGTFTPRTVVGVVAAPLHAGPASGNEQHVYLPYAQFPPAAADLMLRMDRFDAATVAALRAAVYRADPDISIRLITSAEDALARHLVQPAFYAWLLTGFASVALLLAAIGLYGTLAFAVGRRRRELGIRLALGADATRLTRAIVRHGLAITAAGLGIGLVAAFATARLLDGFIYGVTTTDAPSYATATLLFLGVALVASWIPARRAGRIEPAESLRAP